MPPKKKPAKATDDGEHAGPPPTQQTGPEEMEQQIETPHVQEEEQQENELPPIPSEINISQEPSAVATVPVPTYGDLPAAHPSEAAVGAAKQPSNFSTSQSQFGVLDDGSSQGSAQFEDQQPFLRSIVSGAIGGSDDMSSQSTVSSAPVVDLSALTSTISALLSTAMYEMSTMFQQNLQLNMAHMIDIVGKQNNSSDANLAVLHQDSVVSRQIVREGLSELADSNKELAHNMHLSYQNQDRLAQEANVQSR